MDTGPVLTFKDTGDTCTSDCVQRLREQSDTGPDQGRTDRNSFAPSRNMNIDSRLHFVHQRGTMELHEEQWDRKPPRATDRPPPGHDLPVESGDIMTNPHDSLGISSIDSFKHPRKQRPEISEPRTNRAMPSGERPLQCTTISSRPQGASGPPVTEFGYGTDFQH